MTDQFDRAQELDARYLRQSLDDHNRRRPKGASAQVCEDCGEKIPTARRKAAPGCTRCIDCQEKYECIQQER